MGRIISVTMIALIWLGGIWLIWEAGEFLLATTAPAEDIPTELFLDDNLRIQVIYPRKLQLGNDNGVISAEVSIEDQDTELEALEIRLTKEPGCNSLEMVDAQHRIDFPDEEYYWNLKFPLETRNVRAESVCDFTISAHKNGVPLTEQSIEIFIDSTTGKVLGVARLLFGLLVAALPVLGFFRR